MKSIKKFYTPILISVSCVLLTVIFEPFGFSWLGWVAIAGFVIACDPKRNLKSLLIWAYVISTIYWLGNVYWLGYVTVLGWVVFGFYMGLYWVGAAIAIRRCREINLKMWVVVPIVIVGGQWWQGIIFGGFNWRLLGQSQYSNITIIQIADIFGSGGVSFLVAMVNGLIAGAIIDFREKKLLKASNAFGVIIVGALLVGTIFYGRYRIEQTPECVELGVKVAAVQPNLVITDGAQMENASKVFLGLLRESRDAMINGGAELIVWPETMVEAVLDDSFVSVAPEHFRAKIFNKALTRHSSEGVYVLVGAFGGEAVDDGEVIQVLEKMNSAFLYGPKKGKLGNYYSKIHLVPFGEYLPFYDVPLVEAVMKLISPYKHEYQLKAGTDYTIFEMTGKNGKHYKFGTVICYEDTDDEICRKMAVDESGKKRIDWLVNISNDGWFTRYGENEDEVIASTELVQHTAISVFRAVENRVSIVRGVNCGVSCLINSLGEIENGDIIGNLSKNWRKRPGQKGWVCGQLPIDKRVSVFSVTGAILEICCGVLFTLLTIMTIYHYVSIAMHNKKD